MSDHTEKLQDFLQNSERQNARTCVSCQEPWRSVIRAVLDELAEGTAGSGVTMASLHRFMTSDAFDSPYPLTLSALRAHIRHHETDIPEKWVQRQGAHHE